MEDFFSFLEKNEIVITDRQKQQFEEYYELLISENEKVNLTAIVEKEEVYTKHFLDSLLMILDVKLCAQTLCDVGSGAGFPSIPLKIMFPNLKISIVESNGKRCNFLRLLVDKLELKDVDIINERAEEFARKNREKYDLVTARAVANLSVLSELCFPIVKLGGMFFVYKGSKGNEELKGAEYAIKKLGGDSKPQIKRELLLPNGEGLRVNLGIVKNKLTPKEFPRDYSKIKKKPLVVEPKSKKEIYKKIF